MERSVFDLHLSFCKSPLDIAGINEFLPDSGQIVLGDGDVQGCLYGFQIGDVVFGLPAQLGERPHQAGVIR